MPGNFSLEILANLIRLVSVPIQGYLVALLSFTQTSGTPTSTPADSIEPGALESCTAAELSRPSTRVLF